MITDEMVTRVVDELSSYDVLSGLVTDHQVRTALTAALGDAGEQDRVAVIQECMDAVERLRILTATEFKDPKCAGQRGMDRTDAFYEAYHAIRALALSRHGRDTTADGGGA